MSPPLAFSVCRSTRKPGRRCFAGRAWPATPCHSAVLSTAERIVAVSQAVMRGGQGPQRAVLTMPFAFRGLADARDWAGRREPGLRHPGGWRVSAGEAVRISFGFLGAARLVQAAALGLDNAGTMGGGVRPPMAVRGCWRPLPGAGALASRLAFRSLAWSTLRRVWGSGARSSPGRWGGGVALRSGEPVRLEAWAGLGAEPACLRPPS